MAVVVREVKWLATAAVVYTLICAVMLLWQPQTSIEPVSLTSRKLTAVGDTLGAEGRGLSLMSALLHAHMFSEQGIKLKWISERIGRLAESWEHAQKALAGDKGFLFTSPKKILLFPGLLSEYSAYDFANNAYQGGYLGELVQWSDFIAALHMLGHHLVILTSHKQLAERVPLDSPTFDLVFTDYIGLFALRDSGHFSLYKCRIRVLDSFGTEPKYNFRTKDFQVDESLSMFTNWNFEEPRQFWTLFPHTPDNSFLGFVVEPIAMETAMEKKNQGVIYGKEGFYVFGKEQFLNTIAEVIELHATLKDPDSSIPPYVVNHGVLPPAELMRLLQESKVFVGLGFPFDGPGPLEALASGCGFIQPKFNPPLTGKNTPFLSGKPTSRALTSQLPYLEQFVGEPYVYTVDPNNSSAVRQAIYSIITRKDSRPFIPLEFTEQGLLERVGMYILYQNFCDGKDLARGKTASASSSHAEHTAREAVDGLLTEASCFWSAPDSSHWWMVDLGADTTITKIRIINTVSPSSLSPRLHSPTSFPGSTPGFYHTVSTFEWVLAKTWGAVFIDPFIVTLSDSHGNQVTSHKFTDSRTFYLWEEVNVRARFVRIDSLDYPDSRYFVLCAVEVFGEDSRHATWPDLTLMQLLRSKAGQSCKEACSRQHMVCEPAYFRAINSGKTIKKVFNCTELHHSETHYVDFPPALATRDDTDLGVSQGTCVTNGNSALLSCAGWHNSYERLCPCRRFTHGQVAVPPPL